MTAAAVGYSGADNLEVMAEARNYNAFLQRLITAHLGPADEVLDFGAGIGELARPLAEAGYRVRCVEPDAGLQARLTSLGLAAVPSLEALADQSFDVIYTVNVLEHIADDAAAVAALRARLKPGGRLLVYVPAFPVLYSSMDRKVGHLRRYRRPGLAALLRQAGLTVESIRYHDCLGFGASLLFRALGSDGAINRRALIAFDRFVFPLSRLLDTVAGRWFGKNLFAVARL
jgi:SAM-dependent methyltransferase